MVRTSSTRSDGEESDTNLHVHRRLLSTTHSPFPVDDGEGNASYALLAGLSDLSLNLRQELVGLQEVECLQDPLSNENKVI